MTKERLRGEFGIMFLASFETTSHSVGYYYYYYYYYYYHHLSTTTNNDLYSKPFVFLVVLGGGRNLMVML